MSSSSAGIATTTNHLDDLLTSKEYRDKIISILQTLEGNGGVITCNMTNKKLKRNLELALNEYGAVQNDLGFWTKKNRNEISSTTTKQMKLSTQKNIESTTTPITTIGANIPNNMNSTSIHQAHSLKSVYGVALPTSILSSAGKHTREDDEEEEADGPLPSTHASRRLPISQVGSFAVVGSDSNSTTREDWMMKELQATHPTDLLKKQAMTAQTARKFHNHKNTLSSGIEPSSSNNADSRSVATGKPELGAQPIPFIQSSQKEGFRWNHEEMMAVEKIDKTRLANLLSQGIDSKFTSNNSSKKKFL
jgi:hypothetical protein